MYSAWTGILRMRASASFRGRGSDDVSLIFRHHRIVGRSAPQVIRGQISLKRAGKRGSIYRVTIEIVASPTSVSGSCRSAESRK